MHDEELRQLLRRAEADIEPAVAAPRDLCRQVRALDRRRRRQTRLLAASASAVLLTVGLAAWTQWELRENNDVRIAQEHNVGVAPLAVDRNQETSSLEEIARLEAEADFHLLVARRMIAAFEHEQAIERARREVALGDGLDDVRRELD